MNQTKSFVVLHAQSVDLVPGKKNDRELIIMAVPSGVHKITCGLGGTATAVVHVRIDSATAAVLNASLAKLNAEESPQRALFDFEHQGKEAMAWPISFEWRDTAPDGTYAPGVYATAEYSKIGREYVEGKAVRSFSLSFFTDAALPKKKKDIIAGKTYTIPPGQRGSEDNPARITGLDFPYAGTLTNNPAFRENQPLFAVGRRLSAKEMAALAARAAAFRSEAAQLRRYNKLQMERQGQLLKQLMRPECEIVAAIDRRIAAVEEEIADRRARREFVKK